MSTYVDPSLNLQRTRCQQCGTHDATPAARWWGPHI